MRTRSLLCHVVLSGGLLLTLGCSSDDGTSTAPPAAAGGAAGSGGQQSSSCKLDEDCEAAIPETKPASCAEARCDLGRCRFLARDRDGDEQRAKSCVSAKAGVTIEVGKDCDDTKKTVFEGAWDGPKTDGKPDSCDGIDNDCSGKADDSEAASGATCTCEPGSVRECDADSTGKAIDWPKLDAKGKPVGLCKRGAQTCTATGKFDACKGSILPVSEICDGKDNDCDGVVDEDIVNKPLWFYDGDGDGHASSAVEAVASCENPGGQKCPDGKVPCTARWTKTPESTGDCDDKNKDVYPGAWDGPAQKVNPSGIVPPGLQANFVDCTDSLCLTGPDLYTACKVPAANASNGECITGGQCNFVTGAGCSPGENCLLGEGNPFCAKSSNAALCAPCEYSSDCGAGLRCIGGNCAKRCCSDEDCGAGNICYETLGSFGTGVCTVADATQIFAKSAPLGTFVSVNFALGTGAIAPSAPPDAAVRWLGKVESAIGGEHTFYVESNNGIRLYINGKAIIDDWTRQGPPTHSAKATLQKGVPTSIQLDWFDSGGPGVIKLHWEKLPEMPRQVLTLMLPATKDARPDRCGDGPANGKPKDYDCNGKDHDGRVATAALGSVLSLGCDAKCDPLDAGATSAGLARPCGTLPASAIAADGTPRGTCQEGAQVCQPSGQWGECTGLVTPTASEVCSNGLDDNCNGKSDEEDGCVCEPSTPVKCNEFACNPSTVTCSASGKAECPVAHPKKNAQCLSVNDPGEGGAPTGKFGGACQILGKYVCVDEYSVCDAKPGLPDNTFKDVPSNGFTVPWDWNCDDQISYAFKNQAGIEQQLAVTEVPEATCQGNPAIVQAALSLRAQTYCSAITKESTCEEAATLFYCGSIGGSLQNASVFCGKATGYATCEWVDGSGCSFQGGAPQAKILCK